MSLILNNASHLRYNMIEDGTAEDQRDLNQLDRYLAIVEDNKKASRFVPDDALLALDMAGFVRARLGGSRVRAQVSTARLALALVQPCRQTPVQ